MEAPRHGLSDVQFRKEASAAPTPAAREAALTFAAITYADALANGLADPKKVSPLYSVPRPKGDVLAGLARAIEAKEIQPWMAGLAPQDAEYKALSEAFSRYSRLALRQDAQPVPGGREPEAGRTGQAGSLHRRGAGQPRTGRGTGSGEGPGREEGG